MLWLSFCSSISRIHNNCPVTVKSTICIVKIVGCFVYEINTIISSRIGSNYLYLYCLLWIHNCLFSEVKISLKQINCLFKFISLANALSPSHNYEWKCNDFIWIQSLRMCKIGLGDRSYSCVNINTETNQKKSGKIEHSDCASSSNSHDFKS